MIRLLAGLRQFIFSLLHVRTLGAAAMLINEDDEVILVRHNYGAPQWLLPGGGLKRGESFKAAVIREAHEELGVHLTDAGSVELHGIYVQHHSNWLDYIGLYVIKGWTLDGTKSWEIERCGAFGLDQLPESASPAVRRRIDEYCGRSSVSEQW